MGDPAVIDEHEFLARIGGDRALAAQLSGVLLASLPTREAGLASAVERGGGADVARAAHAIRGAVATFAAAGAVDAARALETLGREGGQAGAGAGEGLRAAHTLLHGELLRLRVHLESRFGSPSP